MSLSRDNFISYKPHGRRCSMVFFKKPSADDTADELIFTPTQKIAFSNSNQVRIFRAGLDEKIVVKSPNESIKESSFGSNEEFTEHCEMLEKEIRKEFDIFKLAYPNANPCNLDVGPYFYASGTEWSYRFIMPFISGTQLDKFILTLNDDLSFILILFLACALELQRIHQLGIIHGDIKCPNVLGKLNSEKNNYNIHIIDFQHSRLITDENASTTDEITAAYFAPERRDGSEENLKPDVKQDIYSFGDMLIDLMNIQRYLGKKIINFEGNCPKLYASMFKAKKANPDKRPTLNEMIDDIKWEIGKLKK